MAATIQSSKAKSKQRQPAVRASEELTSSPSSLSLITDIVGATLRKSQPKQAIRESELSLLGESVNPRKLAQYNKVCGFESTGFLPPTWPHIMAFPLHIKLLTNPSFPYPLAGLVHLRNRIYQARPISADEPLDIICHLSQGVPCDKGKTFDISTEVVAGGKTVWQEVSTNLFKTPTKSPSPKNKKRSALPEYENSAEWKIPASKGRDYAKVSGDFNPIHLSAISARLFGFKSAIIHGMWSKARVLSALASELPAAYTVNTEFKLPILLPAQVKFSWQASEDSIDFLVSNATVSKPYLSGNIVFK